MASGLQVTIVTRHLQTAQELLQSLQESKALNPDARISVVEGDYTSADSLAPSLGGHDSVVSLLNRDQTAAQIVVIDATILAGVKHIVPAAFGVDTRLPEIRALPHLAIGAIISEDHLLKAVAESEGQTTFTIIHNGGFLEWLFQYNLALNLAGQGEQPSMVFDDGETKMSMSSQVDIGKAVGTAVMNSHDEAFQNKYLLMHNIAVSQNDLLGLAKELLPDKPWPIARIDTVEAEKKSQEAFDASIASGEKPPASAYHGFFARAFFGKGLGFFPKVDNALLGVEERNLGWLKDVMKTYLSV